MSVGNCVYLKKDLPPKELIQAFRKILATATGDCMGRSYALHCPICLTSKPIKSMCGSMLTVQNRGGDNLFFYKTLGMAQEGDVIVMATGSCDTNPVIDGNIAVSTTLKKLGGLVFGASIRDIKGVFKMEPPVYATGTIPGRLHKDAPGEVSVPISCGSYFTYPGGIIIGDMDGAVIAPLGDAGAVLEAVQKYCVADTHSREEAVAGSWSHEWIDRDLKVAGVETIDGYCRR